MMTVRLMALGSMSRLKYSRGHPCIIDRFIIIGAAQAGYHPTLANLLRSPRTDHKRSRMTANRRDTFDVYYSFGPNVL